MQIFFLSYIIPCMITFAYSFYVIVIVYTYQNTMSNVYTVPLVIGVPTVPRQKQSYLVNTLQSLLYDLSPAERKDIVIVVFVAEVTRPWTLCPLIQSSAISV